MTMQLGRGTFSSEGESGVVGTFRPQLTSLVDVMVFMLVFLIKSFSVQGDIVTPAPDLQLPVTTSKKPPRPVASIEISRTDIMADGAVLALVAQLEKDDSLLVPAVYQWAKRQRRMSADTAKDREVLIQADRESEFSVIKRVMFSCSKAGLSDFTVLAIQEE
jgi:biopolymer transport protein ExbD